MQHSTTTHSSPPTGAHGIVVQKGDAQAPEGAMGQTYLAGGKRLGLRLWKNEAPTEEKSMRAREYETAGYVLSGSATLVLHGQTLELHPGDSYIVPAGVPHTYRVHEDLTVVEATSPPARLDGQDHPI